MADGLVRMRRGCLVVAVAFVVAACEPTVRSPPPTSLPTNLPSSSPSAEPPAEQSLTMAIEGDLSGGLSNAADDAHTARVAAFLYDGLYGYDESLAPVPKLARELATVSRDGLTWTIRLREGVRFHDGSALTAADVVQTYGMARSAGCRFDRAICLRTILDSVVEVDELTVAFTLKARLATFATTGLGIWIESKDAIDASYARFIDGVKAVAPTDITAFLGMVATEEAIPTGPAGADGRPTVDYARFRTAGEALLEQAGVMLPDEAIHTTDGDLDVSLYVRDIMARVRAMDASTTDRTIDAMAVAYPYLDFGDHPVGTGPYTFVSFTPDGGVELAANDEYFLGVPHIKRLSVRVITTDVESGRALADGEIDWEPSLRNTTFEEVRDDPALKFVEYLEFGFVGLYFNLHPGSDALFLDRNLRQAVAYCVDREATARTATAGHGAAVHSEIPPVSWAYPPTGLNRYPMDRARAKALIEASGWTLGIDGIYEKAGQKLATVVALRAGFPQRSQWMELVAEQVRACGIDLSHREVEFARIVGMLDVFPHVNAANPDPGKPFDAYFGGFDVAVEPDPFKLYHSSECSSTERPTTLNYICYQNPVVDKLIEAGLAEFDQAKRAAIYHRYAIALSDDLPVLYAWSDLVREGLRATVDTTAAGGLRLDTPTWFRQVERLTNLE